MPLWGYRFHVTPLLAQWLREKQVLAEPCLEWACWLLDFLLNEAAGTLQPGQVTSAALCCFVTYTTRLAG